MRKHSAMHRITKLLRERRIRLVRTQVDVIGNMAVGAEMPFVLAGLGVIHNHAMIPVAVCHVKLVSLGIDKRFRRQPEVFYVVASLGVVWFADLHQKFAVHGELEHHVVIPITGEIGLPFGEGRRRSRAPLARRRTSARTGEPYIALVIDRDSVQRTGPVVTFAGATPMPEQVAGLVKL